MLQHTVRRVASAATAQSALFSANSLGAHAPKAAASLATPQRKGPLHQRRYSSSKPSSPKNRSNGPKGLPTGDAVSATASSSEVKTPSEKRKRRSKVNDGSSDPFQGFPSVPSTQHLSQEALGLSSFFSMHRPISITHSLPRTTSDEAFAEIFSARSAINKPNDVISTLSRAVDDLEGPMAKMTISREGQAEQAGEGSMTGQFLPFQPPPLPEPQAANGQVFGASSEADLELSPQHRVYRAMFTIEETLDADGQVHVLAHSPKILNDEPGSRYIDRLRRMRHEDALRRREVLHAISVKKRRKLKMKKKKFKKKLKSSRKLRERLHKI
ncbi:unnamed protein product [Parascedosporium putredinis]|uniref:Mitochondrial mRNA-processing protein COX24 C-terminal domain-containing protein n=1 Tax=Parascedosporium putredinis TaxID=1442378 RepID=A0A9P1H8E7_9PEZI|nr:unnamed protein product [Parascedosporium putredinis]CAI8002316.1 unnamed protein product [Parascedosporium putredinis]